MTVKTKAIFSFSLFILCTMPLKAQAVQDTLKFAFTSDLHFGMTEREGELLYPEVWLPKALMGISKRQAQFILVGGDLIDNSSNSAQYDMFDAAMKTSLPWYPMPGNHDIGTTSASVSMTSVNKWLSRGYGRGTNNREFYGIVYKNLAALYILNTQACISNDPQVQTRADMQLAEMDSFFTANKNIPVKIVSAHVPLFLKLQNEDSLYFNIAPGYRSRILSIMNKHNIKYYVAGHQHVDGFAMDGGIKVFFNTALSFQLGSGNIRGYYVYTVTSDTVLRSFYPLNTESQYELKIKTGSNGKINVSPSAQFYDSAAVVKIEAVPNNGWKFIRWSGSLNSTNNPDSIIMNSDKIIEAVYEETNPTYKIINSKSGMGKIILDPPGGVYDANAIVKLSVQADPGWEFSEWTGDKNGSLATDTLLMNCDKEVKALFKKKDQQPANIKPAEDSYVRGGLMYADKNLDGDFLLRVVEGSSDLNRCRAFLKFSLGGIKADVASAVLKMKVKEGGLPDGPGAKAFIFSVSNNSWKENAITWKNAPQAEAQLDSCVAINHEDMIYSWDLTEKVKQKLSAGDTVLSLMIKDKTGMNTTVDFYSKESSNAPGLVLVTNNTSAVRTLVNRFPEEYRLEQNYPNPFNPVTEIVYSVPKSEYVSLKIFDVMGREVAIIADEYQSAGTYKYSWQATGKDGSALPSGMYICSMKAGKYSSTIKMKLLK